VKKVDASIQMRLNLQAASIFLEEVFNLDGTTCEGLGKKKKKGLKSNESQSDIALAQGKFV
jgi:hypothetical protein